MMPGQTVSNVTIGLTTWALTHAQCKVGPKSHKIGARSGIAILLRDVGIMLKLENES